MKRQPLSRPRRAAFTLIEVLTVVAIVALLATMTYGGLRFAQNKSKEKDTIALIIAINKSIQEYKDERGNFPRPTEEKKQEQVDVNGESYLVGPAQMLYQALSGDGTDCIRGGEKASTGMLGSAEEKGGDITLGKIYMDTLKAPTPEEVEKKKKLKLVEVTGETGYYIIDAFRHPIQYQVQELDKNGLPVSGDTMHSASAYEIWSYGKLKKPEDTDEAKKEWITSWNLQ